MRNKIRVFHFVIRVFLFVTLSALTGCHYKKEIPVIGWDQDGNPTQTLIPAKEYSKRLYALALSVEDSALPVLDRKDSKTHWKLQRVSFGVGLDTGLSFGGLFRIGAFPRFKLVFCKSRVC
jgi:hypothetical protein